LKIKIFDIYSRYIVWIYINIITRIAISVLKQYLNLIAKIEYLLEYLCVDRENKTIIIKNAHYRLFANTR